MVDVMLIGVGIEDSDIKGNFSENDSGERKKNKWYLLEQGRYWKNEEYQEQYLQVEYTRWKHNYESKYKNEND